MLILLTKILGDSTSSTGYTTARILIALAGTSIAHSLLHDTIQAHIILKNDSGQPYDVLGPMLYTQPAVQILRTINIGKS